MNDSSLNACLSEENLGAFLTDINNKPSDEANLSDSVNHPNHYTYGYIECIDAIKSSMPRDAYCGYLKGNVMKYIWRYTMKNNPVEDLRKAKWYLNRLIEEELDEEAMRYDP
jgi:hypothetical protein